MMGDTNKPKECQPDGMSFMFHQWQEEILAKPGASIMVRDKGQFYKQLCEEYSARKERLDEHRELVEEIELKTSLLDGDEFWHAQHLATQDDYLMRIYNLRHGAFPDDNREFQIMTGDVVRPRPAILGRCRLPEYTGN